MVILGLLHSLGSQASGPGAQPATGSPGERQLPLPDTTVAGKDVGRGSPTARGSAPTGISDRKPVPR